MKLSGTQQIFSKKIAELILWVYTLPGYGVTLSEAWRSPETQDIYVRQGKSHTVRSKHLDRLAVDLNLFINGKYITNKKYYQIIGEKWQEMGGVWGGDFIGFRDDANHFEWRF